MKANRLFSLVMAICLASGVKAQFNDSADDIYYYVIETFNGTQISKETQRVYIFNFDGNRACQLWGSNTEEARRRIRENPNYFNEQIETAEYDLKYTSSSDGVCYTKEYSWDFNGPIGRVHHYGTEKYIFSYDRNSLIMINDHHMTGAHNKDEVTKYTLKKVEKSYFLTGRSRTPSSKIYE